MIKVITLLFCFIWSNFAFANNQDPIVLVHGLSGWGRDEMLGFRYFGAQHKHHDIHQLLNKAGYKTFTAAVGPFSSNWDRAIELYYQIKGGCVDYGAVHSARHGHKRFGKCFKKGFYPEWDESHKIHLLGHSMGGPTANVLTHLLVEGSREELASPDAADLFRGGKSWVRSVTTLSSPNNSATLAGTPLLKTFVKQLVAAVTAAAGFNDDNSIYDFKLDQWGLKRQKDEKFSSYAKRIFESDLWERQTDFSLHDLAPAGVRKLNAWLKTHESVYYFSISNKSTRKLLGKFEVPIKSVNPLLLPFSLYLGLHAKPPQGLDPATPGMNWHQNDGMCNSISMGAPVGAPISKEIQKGAWYEFPMLNGWDHMDTIGFCKNCDVMSIYYNHAKLLHSLD